MSVRIYTLLSPRQKFDLSTRAIKEDRSESKIIARAMNIGGWTPSEKPERIENPEKVFARVDEDIQDTIKGLAKELGWLEWQVVHACLQNYLRG